MRQRCLREISKLLLLLRLKVGWASVGHPPFLLYTSVVSLPPPFLLLTLKVGWAGVDHHSPLTLTLTLTLPAFAETEGW